MVTLKDIANKTGLSLPTVSHILGNRGTSYNAKTRQRVRDMAEDMGYRPNVSARAIRTGRFGTLALLMSSDPDRSGLFTPLVNGIHDAMDQHDLHLTLARLSDQKLTDSSFVPSILRKWMADGMLIIYNSEVPPRLVELISQYKVPSIWINIKQSVDCIYPEEYKAGYEATERLLRMGLRDVYFADFTFGSDNDDRHFSTKRRYEGYEKAVLNAGFQPKRLGEDQNIPRDRRVAYSHDWLDKVQKPVGVLAITPSTALPNLSCSCRAWHDVGW